MATTSLTYLDSYCERAGDPSFWAEPLNAITNIAFIIFAIYAIRTLRPLSFKTHGDIWALMLSMIAIGLGSGLWHTHATHWSILADIIPIYIFINIAIFSLFIRLLGFRWWIALIGWAIFQAINISFELNIDADTLNGSIMYVPTYALLAFVTIWLFAKKHGSAKCMLGVTFTFTISLICRTIDLDICPQFSLGTHFIWHILNAYVLYGIVRIVAPKPSA